MVWNEDLAKLKQQLKAEDPKESPPAPPPRPSPVELPTRSMAEEDAAFLSAMGVRRPAPAQLAAPRARAEEVLPPEAGLAAPLEAGDFRAAMAQLGGVKSMGAEPLQKAPQVPQAPPAAVPPAIVPEPPQPSAGMLARPPHVAPDFEPDAETMEIPPPQPQGIRPRPGPLLIQLAAGMAIEVDAAIDLRGHSINDAKERIKERIADGLAMGWRTFHVTLGPGEAIRQGFLAFLASPSATVVQRYAQAPVPMGGPQAWILYLGVPGT